MIVVADAGPLLHLFWADAHLWALPPQEIEVVQAVWEEVTAYAPEALADKRLKQIKLAIPLSPLLEGKRLHTGEVVALSYALTRTSHAPTRTEELLLLSDDQRARQVCRTFALPFIGSIGLIIEASREGRVSKEVAEAALRDLPGRGRLYVKPSVIAQAVAALTAGAGDTP
jgi:predicted nucleic acid-binding protein